MNTTRNLGLLLSASLAAAGTLAAGTGTAHAAPAPSQYLIRDYSQGALAWTVPIGTYSVSIEAVGGSGGDGRWGGTVGGAGGHGDVAAETVAVQPGQVLNLLPGGAGTAVDGAPIHGSSTYASYGGAFKFDGGSAGHSADFDSGSYAGGGGGAASVVIRGSVTLLVAGGGGGGGGGGAVAGYPGGQGGDARSSGFAGSGLGAGAGGVGAPGDLLDLTNGGLGGTTPHYSAAGAGGGGGGGWDGGNLGGGSGGDGGQVGGGGGGGGAGGQSYAISANSSIATSGILGDGYVRLDWRPGVDSTSRLAATPSVAQGQPITLTATIASGNSSLSTPNPSGAVTFEEVDPDTLARTVLGTANVTDGQAVLNLATGGLGFGTHAIHAQYAGDDTFNPSTSGYVYRKVSAPITTVAVSPSTLAFGNQAIGALVSKTATITNTGTITWAWTVASTNNGDVNLPSTTCGALAPGQSCNLTISFQPHAAGAVTAAITLDSNFGTVTVPVTGTGVAAPAITAIHPTHGPSAGGTKVTITGRNFVAVTAITINGTAMVHVSCSSTTTCTAVTPKGSGKRHIQVKAVGGISAAVSADRFSYTG